MFDDEDLRQVIMVVSVKKRPWDNCKVTPAVLYLRLLYLKGQSKWVA